MAYILHFYSTKF